jgi:cytochrome c5
MYNLCTIYDNQRLFTNEALRELKGTNCMKAKGYCWDCVDSDQMVLKAVRWGG